MTYKSNSAVRRGILFILLLAIPLGAAAVKPSSATVTENDSRSGECVLRVNYKEGPMAARQMNISDIKYLMDQPGGIQLFKDIDSRITKEWLEQVVNTNNPMGSAALTAKDGSKGCRALQEMATRLTDRAKKKEWPNEDSQELIIGSLLAARFPPFTTNPTAGSNPAPTTGTK